MNYRDEVAALRCATDEQKAAVLAVIERNEPPTEVPPSFAALLRRLQLNELLLRSRNEQLALYNYFTSGA